MMRDGVLTIRFWFKGDNSIPVICLQMALSTIEHLNVVVNDICLLYKINILHIATSVPQRINIYYESNIWTPFFFYNGMIFLC